jgi:16S rRNA processing protein RimM
MKQDELFLMGKIVRTFGSKGEVIFQTDTEILAGIKKLESVFINLNENLVPFFIESLQIRPKNQAIVKFHDIDNSSDSTELTGCSFYIPKALLVKKKVSGIYSFEIEGYKVIDSLKGEIGNVSGILEMPQQSLLTIDFNGKEILVPLVDEFVKKVDKKNKVIYIDTPDGLIDLNMA